MTYVYTDPQGTPLAEADVNGNITATFDYAPYGSQALGTAPNGPGYTGHVNDPDTGLVYMQARYYDPSTGKFLSVDPVVPRLGDVFNFNRYAYANNNPVTNIDATGDCTGSLNQDSAGNCADSGTTTTNSGPSSGGIKATSSSIGSKAANIATGVGQSIENGMSDFLHMFVPPDQGETQAYPANSYQQYGMAAGNIIVGGLQAELTDGRSAELEAGSLASTSRAIYKTSSEATAAARELGYLKVSERVHGQAVYRNGNSYITRDLDGHNGGAWKMANSPKALASKATRQGTFDINLQRIGP